MAVARDANLPVTRVFHRGITAFKAGDYQRAIQSFDQAFQASSSSESIALRINILDSRAAAKEKLNDLKGSLSDAKKVIDLASESPKVSTSLSHLQPTQLETSI
jgi:tetratricopeptide (TPR) repeat protein